MKVPFIDLKRQYAEIKHEIEPLIKGVIDSQQFILGDAVYMLERVLAEYIGVRYAIGLASGTDALTLSMKALGVGPGDEVITSPFSFAATANSIRWLGARPLFSDIDPVSFNLCPDALTATLKKLKWKGRRWINPRTRRPVVGIMPVHLYGRPCDMERILKLAKSYHLWTLEDNAQAVGAEYHGRKVGGFGVAAALSFYPTKNLGAFGDGGAVLTNSPKLNRDLRYLRNHGDAGKYDHRVFGLNSRLDALQAVVLVAKSRYIDRWNLARREKANLYRNLVVNSGLTGAVALPAEPSDATHVYHQFTIRVKNRDKVRRKLGELGVGTGVHYPKPLHLQPAFKDLGYKRGAFPHAEAAAREVLCLPIYPELTRDEQEYVVASLQQALS